MPQSLLAVHAQMTTILSAHYALILRFGCLILLERTSLLLVPSLRIVLRLYISILTISWPSRIKDTTTLEAWLISHLAEASLLHRATTVLVHLPLFHDHVLTVAHLHVAVSVLVAIELVLVRKGIVWLILTSVESIIALIVMLRLIWSTLWLQESLIA